MNLDELIGLGLTEETARTVSDAFAAAMEAERARWDEAQAAELWEKTVESALEAALSGCYDPALACTLIDREKIVPGEDGSIFGLAEQVDALREEKPFLFQTEKTDRGITLGAAPTTGFYTSGETVSMRDAIEGHFQAQRR